LPGFTAAWQAAAFAHPFPRRANAGPHAGRRSTVFPGTPHRSRH